MMDALISAGQRLADAMRAENEALARFDLSRAASLSSPKVQATDAFVAACKAAQSIGARAQGPERATASAIASKLETLTAENRRLLERAVAIQARVIETIAGAARPAVQPALGYGAGGRMRPPPGNRPMALATRA